MGEQLYKKSEKKKLNVNIWQSLFYTKSSTVICNPFVINYV